MVPSWPGASGLAEDVRSYGRWMRDEAEARIGGLYPKARLEDGTEATAIAWIWARTVTCPNPACGIDAPLTSKWWLGKKKGKEAYIVPKVVDGKVEYTVGHDPKTGPTKDEDGTINRNGATCIACGAPIDFPYIRTISRERGLVPQLMAVVVEGQNRRRYLGPNDTHISAASINADLPTVIGGLPEFALGFRVQAYGMMNYADLFSDRQVVALTTFSDLVSEARERVLADAVAAGMPAGESLEAGGSGAEAYADAVATYLGLAVSQMTNKNSSVCSWDSSKTKETVRSVFARQAIPMTWDFAEANPFAGSSGDYMEEVHRVADVIQRYHYEIPGLAEQADASSRSFDNRVVSTDPPYYDNIGYSDLSDFFYVWLRRSLKGIHPRLFSTMLVPKAEELVANPYRHEGRESAREFFEKGFSEVFARARSGANPDYPMTVYYAFKQSETTSEGRTSTGWSTILQGIIDSGWTVTATWPMRSEMPNRLLASGTNALASSIVLVLRPRPDDAPVIDRRTLIRELRSRLPSALETLRSGGIAPVDLAQAAIGPGMGVFSSCAEVIGSDGERMSVAEALGEINAVLDEVLSDQDDELDPDTRWCLSWYDANGFAAGPYGDAETLASARNSSIDALKRSGVLEAGGGRVRLLAPADLGADYDPLVDDRISHWEVVLHIARALEAAGIDAAAGILAGAKARGLSADALRSLAYRLYSISERHGWTDAGIAFNALGSSWPEISAADPGAADPGAQEALDLDSLGED